MLRTPSLSRPLALLVLLAFTGSLNAQERIDYESNAKFRKEGRANSQIMKTLHVLTDVYGPRLTGSPNHKASADWVVKQATAWGFENAHLEPWDFGHPGWVNERFSGFITSPAKDSLVGEVLAWTPRTNGAVKARAVRIDPPKCAAPAAPAAGPGRPGGGAPAAPVCPTLDELNAGLEPLKAKVKGAIVLVGALTKVPVTLNPPATRADDEEMRRRFDLENPAPSPFGNAGPAPTPDPTRLSANKIAELVDEFLVANGAVVRLNDAGREHGQIRAFNNRTFDVTKAVPTVVLRNEDYGRISRLLDDGSAVELEFNIVNQTYPEGKT